MTPRETIIAALGARRGLALPQADAEIADAVLIALSDGGWDVVRRFHWITITPDTGSVGTRAAAVVDFKVGDRVEHSTCGPGTVTRVVLNSDSDDWRERGVHVTFDKVGVRGDNWRGIYDDDWFRNAGAKLTVMVSAQGSDNA